MAVMDSSTTPTGIPPSPIAKMKQPAQVKAPPASAANKKGPDPAVVAKLLEQSGMDPAEAQVFANSLNDSAAAQQALTIQQADSFIQSLQKDPTALSRWQQALTGYKNALGNIANYAPGVVDDTMKQDTYGVYSLITGNPQANLDPYKAVDVLTKGAKDAALNQVPTTRTIMPTFQPLADDTVNTGIESAFQKAMGRSPNQRERDTFNKQYRALETQHYSQQLANAQSPNGGGEVDQTGSPETFAYSNIENTPEALGYGARQATQVIGDMIRAGH